jgi:proteasome accessory factor B
MYSRCMRRIERLINLIAALLDAQRPMTANDIRERIQGYGDEPNFEAFRRAFERDKEALRGMGIPIEVVASDPFSDEKLDAYIIPKDRYYLPQLDLEPDELAALGIASEVILGSGESAGAGVLKLSVEGPSSPQQGPQVVWTADLATEQPLLGPLYAALLDRRPISFDYSVVTAERVRTRTVEPYGLVHRRGHWYLTGRDRDRDGVRSFKVSRISGEVKTLEGSYEVPETFNAAEAVGAHPWAVGSDDLAPVIVRFDRSMRWWAEQNLGSLQTTEAPDEALDVQLPVSNIDALVSWVIGFGDTVEIRAPETARARMLQHLEPYLTDTA